MKLFNYLLLLLALFFSGCHKSTSKSMLALPALISNNMVLQQHAKVNIWGWANPNKKIKITSGWNNKSYTTKADKSGQWLVNIETSEAGGPYSMTIESDTLIHLQNIMLGEVWLCSGQSNMEWPLSAAQQADEAIKNANQPGIRLFHVPRKIASQPGNKLDSQWNVSTPETAAEFSAVGYFFAKTLFDSLRVPIGMIHASWGGTVAEAWTSKKSLLRLNYFKSYFETFENNPDNKLSLEQAIVKYDSINQVIEQLNNPENQQTKGKKEGWSKVSYNDDSWATIKCPSEWSINENIGIFEGIMWLRKTISVPSTWNNTPLVLELGPIDELDETFVNGLKIGVNTNINNWNKNRVYKVPGQVHSRNKLTIAIRAANTYAQGGMIGQTEQLKIYPKNKPQEAISIAGTWKYKIEKRYPARPPQVDPNTPTYLYNGMIHPLINMTIKGVIWYQGESNTDRAYQYRELFPVLINDWRSHWRNDSLPFYFVQIAPYKYGTPKIAAELREAQFLTYKNTANTGMVVTMDIGNPNDIHPTNKTDVGQRLARWALAKNYNLNIPYSGPLYKSYTIDGNSIHIQFQYNEGMRTVNNQELKHFEIAGNNQIYHPAEATINNSEIIVSSPSVTNPVAVRYGWGNDVKTSLINNAGLPASPFRTDNREWVTQ